MATARGRQANTQEWVAAQQVAKYAVGNLWMPVRELEPARVRTVRWPDAELLDTIRELAVDLDEP